MRDLRRRFLRVIAAGAVMTGAVLGMGCGKKAGGEVERIQEAGLLRVAIVDTGSRYTRMEGEIPVGVEPDLAQFIAQALGVEVRYQVCEKEEALGAVSAGEADMALGRINRSGTLSGEYQISDSYGKGYFYGVTRAGDYALTVGAFENSAVGAAKDLDEETRTALYQAEGIRILDYNLAKEGGQAVKDGAVRAYICYEDQAEELLEDEELQVQNVTNLEPEEFVIVAGKSDTVLINGINTLIRQFLEKE